MHALTGTDYEWFCSDTAGNIGIMTTAGEGPVPVSVLSSLELNDRMKAYAGSLAERGSYQLHTRDIFAKSTSGRMMNFVGIGDTPIPDNEFYRTQLKDFIHFARQGFFAYDWQDIHRPKSMNSHCYELVAEPRSPLMVGDLPPQFRALLASRTLESIRKVG